MIRDIEIILVTLKAPDIPLCRGIKKSYYHPLYFEIDRKLKILKHPKIKWARLEGQGSSVSAHPLYGAVEVQEAAD